MPVIRIDEEVYKELQRRAQPFVDTPNSVLRKLLELAESDDGESDDDKIIRLELKDLHTPRTWALIPVPKQKRRFFPGYKIHFDLETDVGVIKTRMTSAPKGTPEGDPHAGAYVQGNLRHWYDNHPELKSGDKLRFEALEPGKRYRLSIVRR